MNAARNASIGHQGSSLDTSKGRVPPAGLRADGPEEVGDKEAMDVPTLEVAGVLDGLLGDLLDNIAETDALVRVTSVVQPWPL